MPLLATVPAGIPPKLSDSLLNAALLFNGTIPRGSHRTLETKTPWPDCSSQGGVMSSQCSYRRFTQKAAISRP